jgi:hypothetical protein
LKKKVVSNAHPLASVITKVFSPGHNPKKAELVPAPLFQL